MKKGNLLLFVLVIALCMACSGCNVTETTQPATDNAQKTTAEPTDSPTAEPTPEPTPEPEPEDALFAIGEMSTLSYWEITVDSFEVLDEIDANYGSFVPAEGNKYVVVTLTVKNTGTSADRFYTSFPVRNTDLRAKILYQGKYEYSSSTLLAHSEDLHDKVLNPLTSLTGILAYQVVDEAATSGGLTLNMTIGKETIVYELK